MEIIKNIDPDFITNIDKTTNIIMCVPPIEENCIAESEHSPDTFEMRLHRIINLSTTDVTSIGVNAFTTIIQPKIKISMPAGLKIQFADFIKKHPDDIFWKSYRSFEINNVYNEEKKLSHQLLTNITMTAYIDVARMRQLNHIMLINQGTTFAEFYFTWYAQTACNMPQIEEIYLISDQYVFEDFLNVF